MNKKNVNSWVID